MRKLPAGVPTQEQVVSKLEKSTQKPCYEAPAS